jgi:hypothetical protein
MTGEPSHFELGVPATDPARSFYASNARKVRTISCTRGLERADPIA